MKTVLIQKSLRKRVMILVLAGLVTISAVAFSYTMARAKAISLKEWKEETETGTDWNEAYDYYTELKIKFSEKYKDELAKKMGLTDWERHIRQTTGTLFSSDRVTTRDLILKGMIEDHMEDLTEQERMEYYDLLYRNPNDPNWSYADDKRTLTDDSIPVTVLKEQEEEKKQESQGGDVSSSVDYKIILSDQVDVQNEQLRQCVLLWCSSSVFTAANTSYTFSKEVGANYLSNVQKYGTAADVIVYGRMKNSPASVIYGIIEGIAILFVLIYAGIHLFQMIAKDAGSIEGWIRLFIFTAMGIVFAVFIDDVFRQLTDGAELVYLRVANMVETFYDAIISPVDGTNAFSGFFVYIVMISTYISIVAAAIGFLFEMAIRRAFAPIAVASIAADGIQGMRSTGLQYIYQYFGLFLRMCAFMTIITMYSSALAFITSGNGPDTLSILAYVAVRVATLAAISTSGKVIREVFK